MQEHAVCYMSQLILRGQIGMSILLHGSVGRESVARKTLRQGAELFGIPSPPRKVRLAVRPVRTMPGLR